ncbi:aminotransferase class IV [Bacteroidota bacterium]
MECYKDFFIHNFKLKRVSEFDEYVTAKGISIYEVIRIRYGIPLFLEDHLNRLFDSADISNLQINESYCDIETLISELIKKNNTKEGKIKLVIHFEKEKSSIEKNLLIYFTPHYFPSTEEYKYGVRTGLCRAIRTNPNAKVLNTEARRKANSRIAEEKLFEVLLINEKGLVTEGSRSNIFFIKNSKIITPLKKDILNGVTRRNIIKICKKGGIELIEQDVHYSKINSMDSVFLTGTSLKALPIRYIEKKEFRVDHIILNQIIKLYENLVKEYVASRI